MIEDYFDTNLIDEEIVGLNTYLNSKISEQTEVINSNINYIENEPDDYEEGICSICGKKVDYDLYCMDAVGDGPCVCYECAGEPEY